MEGNEIGTQVNDNIQKLIDQLSHIKFEGMVMCAVMLVLCLVLCLEGYQIYRLALLLIGFAMGFVTMHSLLDTAGVVLTSEQRLMAQGIAGIILAILSTTIVRVGVFISAFYFAKYFLAGPIAQFILARIEGKVDYPKILTPVITNALALIVAFIFAKLAVESLRPVIVILTAAVGGFALVNIFVQMIPIFPINISFMPGEGSFIWGIAKLFMTAAGVGVQGIKGEET